MAATTPLDGTAAASRERGRAFPGFGSALIVVAAVDATESAADAAIVRLEAARLAGIARLAPRTGNGADAWQLYKSVV